MTFADEIDEALWDEACRRADAIRSFLVRNSTGATAAEVADLAAELSLSQAAAYRLIKLFRAGGTILSLVDRKCGRPEGHRTLDEKREEVVRSTINAFYLKRTRPTISQLVRDVQTNCISAGLPTPAKPSYRFICGPLCLRELPSSSARDRRCSECCVVT
ncbi:hypothetical protein J2X76_006054 [Neorhizobium sp. 2083]|uniref:hypothetical protein n=1 Tax=Neorhizobium sp. 2083 TaxID=2817762 RepID=UPI0028596F57|nr:hypothetical protein [Neorhizobium sp. 2083]MDR6820854.1 hypothetical protein [Neorhizobium sp. 2083]